MEVTKISVPKNSEDGGKHPNHVNENVAVRTKNGLVNGVAGTKCKNNKKQKATNSVKKGQAKSKVQEQVDKMGESNRIEVPDEAKDKLVDNCTSVSSNESALNQSKTKLNDQSSKSKKNKKLKNCQQDNSSTLPKLDINASVNLDHFMTNMKMISELPSTSHLDVNKSPLLQCGSSEFEKNLIESIKSLKIQNENSESKAQSEGAPEINTQSNESTQLEEEQQHCDIKYVQYESELQMPMIMKIIQKDLSEPYSIYTYRYFIHNWPKLCFLAMCDEKCVGAIVCKLDYHRKSIKRGYIAMLAVDKDYRKRKIGSTLVSRAISQMVEGDADEVVLETEVTNKPALRLYEQLGFVRDKRLFRYYLNGVDALRLKLWLR